MTSADLTEPDGTAVSDRALTTLRALCWLIALSLGALEVWAKRFPIGEDGVSYLDIADSYLRGDWHNVWNAYWSPLYSWLLAAGLGLTHPTPFMESTVVHLVNFLIYVGALAAFDFLLRQLLVVHGRRERAAAAQGDMRLPVGALLVLGFALFTWISVAWIGVSLETPDLCLTIFVYLTVGLLLRIRTQPSSVRTFLVYGVVLALAALTKSAMFTLSIVFFALLFLAAADRRTVWRGVAAAVVAFAVVAGPYVVGLSLFKGRLTFGDTGKIAYVLFATGDTDRERYWYREFPDDQRPVHPTRKVLDRPALYAFGSAPVAGTYPVYYDPSYWHEGEQARLDLRSQLRRLRFSAEEWWGLFVTNGDFLVFGALILFVVAWRPLRAWGRELLDHAELILPCLVALGVYSIVLLTPRYVAVFMVLLWIGIFASMRLPRSAVTRRLAWTVPTGIVLLIALRLLPWSSLMVAEVRSHQQDPRAHQFWQIAEGLRTLGAKPGDNVAVIGYGPPAYWARLARVRIVGEMWSEEREFSSVPGIEAIVQPDGSLTPEAIQAFVDTGAQFVVARRPPANVVQKGWTELGEGLAMYGYPLPR